MSDAPNNTMTFEQALAELERIVHELEEGDVSLEQSLARYEQGVGLLKRCHAQLQSAEQRIAVLTGQDEQGRPQLRPFDRADTMRTPSPDGRPR
jgi:exodeoxyribonuclease VII small subunit